MIQKEPKVIIIVLNWNGVSDTLSLLQSLEAVRYPNFSVLIVDNASKDDSLGRIARYMEESRQTGRVKFKISLLPNSANFGFAEGNNRGVKQAAKENPDYYLFLNNDTFVAPDFLDHLVEAAESDETIALAGPLIYRATSDGAKTNQVWYAGGWLNWFAGGAHHKSVVSEKQPSVKNSRQPLAWESIDFISGCCLLAKRQLTKELGQFFDSAFFAYGEDVDLCLRVQKTGFALAYVPRAIVWHKLAASSGGPKSANFWYYNTRNNFLLMARYASWYHWPVFISYFLFYKPVLWSIVGTIARPRKDKWRRLQAIYRGTVDAMTGKFGKITRTYNLPPTT